MADGATVSIQRKVETRNNTFRLKMAQNFGSISSYKQAYGDIELGSTIITEDYYNTD